MESLYAITMLRNKPGPLPDPLAKLSYPTERVAASNRAGP